jgi:hypothetical protein
MARRPAGTLGVGVSTAGERTATPSEPGDEPDVDVERAPDLYAQGWTLRQIGAELGVPWTTVSQVSRSSTP